MVSCLSQSPTLLSFSPSLWGMSVLRDWKPELMLCMRRRSLLLAISRRIRLSWSRAVSGVRGIFARLGRRGGGGGGKRLFGGWFTRMGLGVEEGGVPLKP